MALASVCFLKVGTISLHLPYRKHTAFAFLSWQDLFADSWNCIGLYSAINTEIQCGFADELFPFGMRHEIFQARNAREDPEGCRHFLPPKSEAS